jgi:ABC-type transporter MlaC component
MKAYLVVLATVATIALVVIAGAEVWRAQQSATATSEAAKERIKNQKIKCRDTNYWSAPPGTCP